MSTTGTRSSKAPAASPIDPAPPRRGTRRAGRCGRRIPVEPRITAKFSGFALGTADSRENILAERKGCEAIPVGEEPGNFSGEPGIKSREPGIDGKGREFSRRNIIPPQPTEQKASAKFSDHPPPACTKLPSSATVRRSFGKSVAVLARPTRLRPAIAYGRGEGAPSGSERRPARFAPSGAADPFKGSRRSSRRRPRRRFR
jgi:hypothetical protein